MSEIRCPMCGKPNEALRDTCVFCDARLKPLVIHPPGNEDPADRRPSGPSTDDQAAGEYANDDFDAGSEQTPLSDQTTGEDVPDWLARIRRLPDDVSSPTESDPAQDDDWLSRLRADGPSTEAEAEEDDASQPPQGGSRHSAEEQPTLEDSEEQEEALEPSTAAPGGLMDFSAGFEDDAEEDQLTPGTLPGWLQKLRDKDLQRQGLSGEPGAPAMMEGRLPAEPDPDLEQGSRSDRLEPFDTDPDDDPDLFLEDLAQAVEDDLQADWTGLTDEGEPLEAFAAREQAGEADHEEPSDEQVEDVDDLWEKIQGIESEIAAASADYPADDRTEVGDDFEDSLNLEEAASFDFDEDDLGLGEDFLKVAAAEQAGSELPDWLEDLGKTTSDSQSRPPLVFGDRQDVLSEGAAEEQIDLPDWSADDPGVPEPESEPDLERASLPNWLESMRPIETFKPLAEESIDDDRFIETAGPLAGFLGVLSAEPIVAMPRMPTAGGGMLEISERQFAQADILRRLVQEEDHETPAPRLRRRRLPILRWITALALIGAILLTALLDVVTFPTPTRVSRDLVAMVNLVNSLPLEAPTLLVFDYEAASAPEMDATAAGMIDHMLQRGNRLAMISTTITGQVLADRLVSSIAERYGSRPGSDYLNLGYLAGGQTAIQLLATAPRETLVQGFLLPQDLRHTPPWDAPLMSGIETLADFNLVAVITESTETARIWAEQAHPAMGSTPLAMVLSSGAAPMVRPYYEARVPSVQGILTGLPAAVVYEKINQRPDQAVAVWDGFGAGALIVVVGIVGGIVVGLLPKNLLRRRRDRHRA